MHFNKVNWYEIIELSYLEDLKILFDETQRMWRSNLNEIGEEIERLDESDRDEYVDHHYDTIVQMRETLPRITNNSILTNIYSFFEANLIDFYNEVKRKLVSDISAKHLTDKLHFINESCTTAVITENEIIQLDFIRELRNRIMHSKGLIENNFAELAKRIEECPKITTSDRKELIISNDFISDTFELVEDVLRNLNSNIKNL
ncbi:hypothetical protein [Paenibacillus faecalis]|uniref:hypothetical protein n=1 Tax=Paenibacillus faecalis TaxID=2079532 RepID=UPI000D0E6DC1|nr:hypothetical protein [Paenibacillus faecalis]